MAVFVAAFTVVAAELHHFSFCCSDSFFHDFPLGPAFFYASRHQAVLPPFSFLFPQQFVPRLRFLLTGQF